MVATIKYSPDQIVTLVDGGFTARVIAVRISKESVTYEVQWWSGKDLHVAILYDTELSGDLNPVHIARVEGVGPGEF